MSRLDKGKQVIDKKQSSSRTNSALAERSVINKYPKKWVRPKLPEYKGTSDPKAHIIKFVANMKDVTNRQNLLCRMFVRTLEGEAI